MNSFRKLPQLLIIGFLLAFVAVANAQEGSPFVTNYAPTDESLNENYSICQDKEGTLLIANRKGILTFDAEEWKLIKTPELPLIVQPDPSKTIVFVGCRNNVGYLVKNQIGEYEYVSIVGKEAGTVTQIVFHNSFVYFLSQTAITRVNINDVKDIYSWKGSAGKEFNHIFLLNDRLIVDINKEGLKAVKENELISFQPKFALNNKIVFSLAYDKKTILLGANDNHCYLFDGTNTKQFSIEDQQYINDGGINDGKLLEEDKIVISTAGSGCLVFDKKTGKTIFTVNIQNGLPDDEVLALSTDRNHGIWVAHYYGLTRIDVGLPVKNYTTYKGLNGKPQAVEFFNGKLYVGTTNGLYFLDKKKDFVEYSVRRDVALPTIKPAKVQEVKTETEVAKPEPKTGLLGRLFGKKTKEEPVKTDAVVEEQPEKKESGGLWGFFTNKTREKQTQKVYKLASVTHNYVKISGFEYKCKQLINFNGKLLAITISGVYEVSESKATEILSKTVVHSTFYAADEKTLYLCTDKGITALKNENGTWKFNSFLNEFNEPVFSIAKDMFDNFWIGLENKAIRIKLKRDGSVKDQKVFEFNSEMRERVVVRISNKKPVFFLTSGIYSIYNDSIQLNKSLTKFAGQNSRYFFAQQTNTLIFNGRDWLALSASAEPDSVNSNYLNLFDNASAVVSDNNGDKWVVDGYTSVYKVNQKEINAYKSDFNAFIKRFSGGAGESFSLNGVELDQRTNFLKIHISAPYFIKPYSNQYQYKISGLSHDWSDWTSNPEFSVTLGSGNWEISVRAKNIFGKVSEEQILSFKIDKPFYQTWWFILLCAIALAFGVFLLMKYRERQLQHDKEVLEEKVRERTRQIEEQKEEIEAQRDQIVDQNREITDSIRYAKRLQTAVMPDNAEISGLLSDYFVLFRPKDIVSGDFYWAKKKGNKVIVAAADCTGHGVPGGFLSMLGISLLNEISAIDRDFRANEMLNILKSRVIGTLTKEGQANETKDGMDISLCIIDLKSMKMEYAGANNSIYLIRNKELIEYNPDKMPIGSYIVVKESFTNNDIELKKNDTLYMFSDGFRDQMGGPNEKRIKSAGFRKLLLDNNDKPMRKQRESLETFFDEWRGEHAQVDDIMVLGIRI